MFSNTSEGEPGRSTAKLRLSNVVLNSTGPRIPAAIDHVAVPEFEMVFPANITEDASNSKVAVPSRSPVTTPSNEIVPSGVAVTWYETASHPADETANFIVLASAAKSPMELFSHADTATVNRTGSNPFGNRM